MVRFLRMQCSLFAFFVFALSMEIACAETHEYCALGETLRPHHELLETRRVLVILGEESAKDLITLALAEKVIRRRIWPGRADRVYLSDYVDGQCGPEGRPADIVQLTILKGEAEQLRDELQRGQAGPDGIAVAKAAARAHLQTASITKAPLGASKFNHLRIYYATNRDSAGNATAPEAFGSGDSDKMSWGTVDVSIPASHEMAHLETPSIWRLEWIPNKDRHIVIAPQLAPLSLENWRVEVRSRALSLNRPGVLLFVPGYNVSFVDGARRAAQLAYDIAFEGPLVYFSWPSDGRLLQYMRDETTAFNAWGPMKDVLQTITGLAPGTRVYMIGHSMGNRVMLHGLAELLRDHPNARHSLQQVVMAAPDVGLREFKNLITKDLAGTAPRYTLYANLDDIPVGVSEWLHDDRRLGDGGPGIAVFVGVDSIDASAISKEFFSLHHSYFGDSTSLLSDLFTLIHSGTEPSKRFRLKPVLAPQGRYWIFVP